METKEELINPIDIAFLRKNTDFFLNENVIREMIILCQINYNDYIPESIYNLALKKSNKNEKKAIKSSLFSRCIDNEFYISEKFLTEKLGETIVFHSMFFNNKEKLKDKLFYSIYLNTLFIMTEHFNNFVKLARI